MTKTTLNIFVIGILLVSCTKEKYKQISQVDSFVLNEGYFDHEFPDTVTKVIWEKRHQNPIKILNLFSDDTLVYLSWPIIFFVSVEDGEKFKEIELNSLAFTAPIFYENNFFYSNESNEVISVNKNTGMQNWKKKLSSSIFNEPVISNNRMFIGCSDGYVYELDISNGRILWESKIGEFPTTPLLYKNYLISGSKNGYLYVLNKDSGELQFKIPTNWMISNRPLIHNNILLVPSGELHAFNLDDGFNKIWETNFNIEIYHSPSAYDNTVYFGSAEGRFFAVKTSDGSIVWEKEFGVSILEKVSLSKEKVVFTTMEGWVYCLRVKDGEIFWGFKDKSDIPTTPIPFKNGFIFGNDIGELYFVK